MTASPSSDRLYNLLPAVYRLRDAEQGGQLRALLGLIGDELSAVEADIRGLYENWFVETADEWVVPYLGDLLGVRGLNPLEEAAFSLRAYVANTIFYRRRKGTAHVLGVLAGDVTGWPARAVEFFELLQTTQYLNHLRLANARPDLRQTERLARLDTPFDTLPHTADVRHIRDRRGRHNIPNVGLFLWRLQNYPLRGVTARQAGAPNAHGYHFNPLGSPTPLFNLPRPTPGFPQQEVPAPIHPLDFHLDLAGFQEQHAADPQPPDDSRLYGPQRSLSLVKDGVPVPPMDILCKDLSAWARPPAGRVAVDVGRGRISFAAGEEPASGVTVDWNYGFSADLGGGPYDRRARMTEIRLPVQEFAVGVGKPHTSLAAALTAWENAVPPKPPAVVRIYDSATYDAHLTIDLPPDGMLVIDCENGERPTLVEAAPLRVTSAAASAAQAAAFTLGGVLLEGRLELRGKLDATLVDCTLVPGRALDEDGLPLHPGQASLLVTGSDVVDTAVRATRCILGPLQLPEACRRLSIADSLVWAPPVGEGSDPARAAIAASADGVTPGPLTVLERVTVFGGVHVKVMELASEVIFVHPLVADRRQEGCVRFSYLAEGSKAPRRYRCQPDLALAARQDELGLTSLPPDEYDRLVLRLRPQFTDLRFGRPAFAQLASACPDELKAGAGNGAEMGAFCLLQQPQRLANLRLALDEYLRFGLEAGIFLVT